MYQVSSVGVIKVKSLHINWHCLQRETKLEISRQEGTSHTVNVCFKSMVQVFVNIIQEWHLGVNFFNLCQQCDKLYAKATIPFLLCMTFSEYEIMEEIIQSENFSPLYLNKSSSTRDCQKQPILYKLMLVYTLSYDYRRKGATNDLRYGL